MFKSLKTVVLGSFAILGAITFSCSKQDSVSEPTPTEVSQRATEDLADIMAGDDLVSNDLEKSIAFLHEHEKWFNALTPTEQKERIRTFNESLRKDGSFTDPSHTAEQMNEHFVAMHTRLNDIVAKYPKYAELDAEGRNEVNMRIYKTVTSLPENSNLLGGNGCENGYYACSRYCRDAFSPGTAFTRCVESCYAGFMACIYSSTPPQP